MAPNERMARFSLSYIKAVASHAGFQVVEPKVDHDSVDGILMADFGRRPRIEFQAKATAREVVPGDDISFALPVKNYEDLRLAAINPRILIVLLMPKLDQDWIDQTADELCLRRCAYWTSLVGHPTTANTSSVTVHVPMVNVFSSSGLTDMMQKAEQGGDLC